VHAALRFDQAQAKPIDHAPNAKSETEVELRARPLNTSPLANATVAPGVATPEEIPLSHYAPFEANPTTEADCTKRLRANFMGDVYLAAERAAPTGDLLARMKPLLAWGDFNIANLEGVVTQRPERAYPDFPFALRIHPKTPAFLFSHGIRHVTRANNHSMDFGPDGMRDTDAALVRAGLNWTGVGENISESLKPLLLEHNGLTLGILAFTTTYPDGAWASDSRPGVPYPLEGRLRSAVEKLRDKADHVVVTFHWGEERNPALRSHQPELARIALAAGADTVIGHHAHVAQAVENIDGKWAVYGLGNFLFHSNSHGARLGLLASLELCRDPLNSKRAKSRLALVPLDTFNHRTGYATRPMTPKLFAPFAAYYLREGWFPKDAPFHVPVKD